MNNLFRGIIAGIGAKKLGGGCFSTIIIFVVIYWALGQCSSKFPEKKKAPSTVKVSLVYTQLTFLLIERPLRGIEFSSVK